MVNGEGHHAFSMRRTNLSPLKLLTHLVCATLSAVNSLNRTEFRFLSVRKLSRCLLAPLKTAGKGLRRQVEVERRRQLYPGATGSVFGGLGPQPWCPGTAFAQSNLQAAMRLAIRIGYPQTGSFSPHDARRNLTRKRHRTARISLERQ